MLKRLFGDRAFISKVFRITIPMVIQRAVTSFVNLLDNIMVGQVGTLPMSGVSIANQLITIFNLCIFGACSGVGIFTAQYKGARDDNGIRYTFRLKFLVCGFLSILSIGVFTLFGSNLIQWYLTGDGSAEDAAQTLSHGLSYLKMMFWGLIPFGINNVYATTLREMGETKVPMFSSIVAVLSNLVLNYILIFGHLGLPAMGATGAALATVISRYVELVILVVWTHTHTDACPFIRGIFRSFRVPADLLKRVAVKGSPLMFNEILWSIGVFFVNQGYSTCGQDVVPAFNIASTLYNLTNVSFMALGSAVGIIMGQILGAGTPEPEVRRTSRHLLALATAVAAAFALVLAGFSGLFPLLYNTTDSVRQLATSFILITALFLPLQSFVHSSYFIIRSGGQTLITFLFDGGSVWMFRVPIVLLFTRLFPVDVLIIYTLVHATFALQIILGVYVLRKGSWIQQLTH